MTINTINEIEVQIKQRQMDEKRKGTPAHRRITIDDARDLFDNQTPSMQEHLIHDCPHRMLPHFVARKRTARPPWVVLRAIQLREAQ